jgi:formyl-CoA transferase
MTGIGFFAEEDHPSEGRLRTIGIPQRWSESTPEMRYPAPRLGEHSEQLLREFGFGEDEIGELVASGAAGNGGHDDA